MTTETITETTYTPELVPARRGNYVPFGHFNDVRAVIQSGKFVPLFITGLSGNGKTMMVEQVCAVLGKEMVRVNVTAETDEDDLLGGFRLKNGQTVWEDGPVITAMKRGAVLLLDEVDLGSSKLMCLQPILEGNAVYLKKINQTVSPEEGFTVIATANTKGQGSASGKFIGTNILNEAFLERFAFTLEQEYPQRRIESNILKKVLKENDTEDAQFVDLLVRWAGETRRNYAEQNCDEIISTRRLVHICQAYAIFGQKREKAIELCLNRFDPETKNSFMEYYAKMDETIGEEKDTSIDVKPGTGDAW